MPAKLNPFTCKPDLVLGPGSGTATVQFDIDAATVPGTDPTLPTGAGAVTISGAAVAAHSVPVETHARAANAFNIEVQVGAAVTGAPGNTDAAGLAQFDDTQFTVDADGYVSLIGGGMAIDTLTGDAGGAVAPDGVGNIDVQGVTVANAANAKPVFVQGTGGSNLIEVDVQVGAAITGAPADANDAGLVSFDDTQFSVDANGYVALIGGGVAVDSFTTDTSGPVSADAAGTVDVTGSSIFSDGSVANTLTLNVQATANTLLYGGGSNTNINELGPLTDGQLVIGSTGLAPVAGSLASADGSITITTGAGTIDLSVAAGDDAILTLTGDAGGAISPSSGNIDILGGTGISTSGAASAITINLDTPVSVSNGGTGATTLTDGGILLGSGTGAITATSQPTNGQILIGSTGVDPVLAALTEGEAINVTNGAGSITLACEDASDTNKGVATFDENDFLVTSGDVTFAARTRLRIPCPGGYVENLGLSYSSSTLSITGADGTALSATNPGYVTLPSATANQYITIEVTADQGFIDDTGASEIVGNLFGLTTGVAFTNTVPFYIYAVLNDAENAVAFMIGRTPTMTLSPASGEIGDPASAVADDQFSFFSFDNITQTEYDTNPCLMVGSFRMTMSASDDWTVSALLPQTDGIGKYQERTVFTYGTGTFGAASGKLCWNNGGSAPTFVTQIGQYQMLPFQGRVIVRTDLQSVTGAGTGAVEFRYATPFRADGSNFNETTTVGAKNTSSQVIYVNSIASSAGTYGVCRAEGTTSNIVNTYWTSANQALFSLTNYKIDPS